MHALVHSRVTCSLMLGAVCGCASTIPASGPPAREPTISRTVVDASHPASPPVESVVGRAPSLSLQGTGAPADEEWQFSVTPYIWALGLDGHVTVKGMKSKVDVGFDDLLDEADFAGQVHLEAFKNKWGMFFDGTLVKLSMKGSEGPINVKVDFDITMLEAGAFYRLRDETNANGRRTTVDLLGGARYMDFDGKLKFDSAPNVDGGQDWIDPIVGARMTRDLSENWAFNLRGDIGGFDLGDSSDFVWDLIGLFGWSFGTGKRLWIGYRYLDIDYDDGSGSDKFKFDAVMAGPLLGLSFGF